MKAFLGGSTAEHVDPGMVYLPPTLAPPKLNERGRGATARHDRRVRGGVLA